MTKNLYPTQIVTSGNMTSNITSTIIDGRDLKQLKFQIVYTGVPVGTFSLQESVNYNPSTGVGTWLDNGSGISAAAAAGASTIVNLSNRAPCFYRLVYTASSGSGTLNVHASGSGDRIQ